MRATIAKCHIDSINTMLITDPELKVALGCGMYTARKIAEEAGAVVRVGKRKLNNIKKIQKYLDEISE